MTEDATSSGTGREHPCTVPDDTVRAAAVLIDHMAELHRTGAIFTHDELTLLFHAVLILFDRGRERYAELEALACEQEKRIQALQQRLALHESAPVNARPV